MASLKRFRSFANARAPSPAGRGGEHRHAPGFARPDRRARRGMRRRGKRRVRRPFALAPGGAQCAGRGGEAATVACKDQGQK